VRGTVPENGTRPFDSTCTATSPRVPLLYGREYARSHPLPLGHGAARLHCFGDSAWFWLGLVYGQWFTPWSQAKVRRILQQYWQGMGISMPCPCNQCSASYPVMLGSVRQEGHGVDSKCQTPGAGPLNWFWSLKPWTPSTRCSTAMTTRYLTQGTGENEVESVKVMPKPRPGPSRPVGQHGY
jgi:hypothetical protein